jgi:phosphoglycolate phosphatase
MKNRSFELLVFDWDGTLMDSEARIVECVRAAVAELGLDVPPDSSIRNIIGLGLTEAITALFSQADDQLIHEIADRYRQHFLFQNQTPMPLFAGVEETLRELESRGYLLAVATGKSRRGLERSLEHTDLGKLFHATRCADETFSKPHPEMLLQLMDELGTMPGETLMIGDTEYDMEMASNAGTASLAVSCGVHEVERLLQHGPEACLQAVSEMVGWLDGGRCQTA